MIGPITPKEARILKRQDVPEAVFESFNRLIAADLDESGYATVKQHDAINLICARMGIERDAFNFKWLDIEDFYRDCGWEVEYEKPSYDEGGTSTFTFKQKETE